MFFSKAFTTSSMVTSLPSENLAESRRVTSYSVPATKVAGTEYEVTLRDSAKFSDGSDVTIDDVVNAFEKNMANSTYGAFLSFIDTVTKKDDKTVTFKLKYAFDESLIPARLSVVKIFPASLSEDDLKTKPIGSGPWAYDEVNGEDGGKITFKPNEYYTGLLPGNRRRDGVEPASGQHRPHHRFAGGHRRGYGERARRQRRAAHRRRCYR